MDNEERGWFRDEWAAELGLGYIDDAGIFVDYDGWTGEPLHASFTVPPNFPTRALTSGQNLDTCICGRTVLVKPGNVNFYQCRCGKSWYHSHCYNCSLDLDTRSGPMDRCDECAKLGQLEGWYICPQCGHCGCQFFNLNRG
jgi:hypothetical protein